jgi:WD40 repeat protein
VAFSTDGKFLLALDGRRVVCGWPLSETPEKRLLFGHNAGIPAVAFSPDGGRLASVSKDHTLRLWDLATGRPVRTLRGHKAPIEAVEFSPDGERVATGDFLGVVRLWDAHSGREVAEVGGPAQPPGQVWRLRFAPDGEYLVAAGGQGVAAWAVHGGALEPLFTVVPPGQSTCAYDVAVHPAGHEIMFLDQAGRLYAYRRGDPAGPRRLRVAAGTQVRTLHFSPAGDRFTFVTPAGTLATWDWHRGALARDTGQRVFHLALGAGGRWVAASTPTRAVVVYDLHEGCEVLTLPPEENDVWGLAWSPDGTRLAVGLSDGGLAVWDLEQVRARLAEFDLAVPSTARDAQTRTAR